MGGNAIDAIGNGYKKASTYLAGFGTKEVRNIKKFLFEQNGQVAVGHAPAQNTGSAFGWGFAASNGHDLGGTNI